MNVSILYEMMMKGAKHKMCIRDSIWTYKKTLRNKVRKETKLKIYKIMDSISMTVKPGFLQKDKI